MATKLRITRAVTRFATSLVGAAGRVQKAADNLHINALLERVRQAWCRTDDLQASADDLQRAAWAAGRKAAAIEIDVNAELKELGL